jgi:hypothetical protein
MIVGDSIAIPASLAISEEEALSQVQRRVKSARSVKHRINLISIDFSLRCGFSQEYMNKAPYSQPVDNSFR